MCLLAYFTIHGEHFDLYILRMKKKKKKKKNFEKKKKKIWKKKKKNLKKKKKKKKKRISVKKISEYLIMKRISATR